MLVHAETGRVLARAVSPFRVQTTVTPLLAVLRGETVALACHIQVMWPLPSAVCGANPGSLMIDRSCTAVIEQEAPGVVRMLADAGLPAVGGAAR